VASHEGDRAVALSRQLVQAHQELRRRISEMRTGLGHGASRDDEFGAHCLAFCSALTAHHRGEDEGLFAQLRRERPELAPTIAKLVEDHRMIGSLLTRLRELADTAATLPDPTQQEAIRREIDGLAAIMESHFRYEERELGAALDRTDVPTGASGTDAVFRFGSG
jgi:iron-sulfur cluster repair protein YtfE (RIC family)